MKRLLPSGSSFFVSIYDRWGRMLFSTDNPYQSWNGGDQPAGVYVWMLEYKAEGEGSKLVTGSVTVLQ